LPFQPLRPIHYTNNAEDDKSPLGTSPPNVHVQGLSGNLGFHQNHYYIIMVCLSLTFLIGTSQLLLYSVSPNVTLWTYPSGYDPHGGYVDRIIFKIYPLEDLWQSIQDLEGGVVYSLDEQLNQFGYWLGNEELEANPAIELTSGLETRYRQFTIQCQRFPTNITGYRVALAQALDKLGLVERYTGGLAQAMDNPIPLAFEFWSYEDQMTSHFYSEDIASANATLDAAHIIDPWNDPNHPHPGWRFYDADLSGNWTAGDKRGDIDAPDGLKIEVWTSASYGGSGYYASLELVTAIEKCGLHVKGIELSYNSIVNGLESGDYSIVTLPGSIEPPGEPSSILYNMFYSEAADNAFFYRFNNSDYDSNCTRFMRASTRMEARNWAWNCCRILMAEMPMIVCFNEGIIHAYRTDLWEGYVNQVGIGVMGGNPYTYQSIRLKGNVGGPFGCYPTEYITVLFEGMDFTNTILSSSPYSETIFHLIYSKLWQIDPLDPFTRPAPDLAYAWTLEPTMASGDIQAGMKYTFYLYENITWHDGTPFTAEDVQYSLMNIHPWGTYTSENVASIYRVDNPDPYTVEIYSNESGYVTFAQATSVQILPKHIWSPYEAENFTWTPEASEDFTGTGCYRWVDYTVGQEIILDRYDGWHFAIEQPFRIPCLLPAPPLWFTLLASGGIIILVQVIILSLLIYRHQKRQIKGGKATTELTKFKWRIKC
jgi:ABC-type transport system substrate-binding protein